MDRDSRFESVFSKKVKAGKRRTYFFDVRRTKGDDFYLTLTESTKRFNGNGYERHKIFLYKEDFNRFLGGLEEVIDYIKTELMPDYDYEAFDRRQEEWEARYQDDDYEDDRGPREDRRERRDGEEKKDNRSSNRPEPREEDDDMSW